MSWWPEDQDAVRAVLRRVAVVNVDDSGSQQFVDLDGLASEQFKGVVRVLPHGFNSNPPVGSEGMVLALGGRADRAMVFGLEDQQSRKNKLTPGQSVLYDDAGNVIFAKGKKGIDVQAAKGDVAMGAPAGITYLGGTGHDGTYAMVLTQLGPSPFVWARVS